MKILIRLFLLASVLGFSSCAKETKDEQKKLILLTNPKGWLTTKIERQDGNGWVDVTNQLTPLQEDNLSFYKPDLVWWDDEGPVKFPGDPQIIDYGNYALIQDLSQIQKDNGDLLEIVELTKESMILVRTKNNITTRTTYKIPN